MAAGKAGRPPAISRRPIGYPDTGPRAASSFRSLVLLLALNIAVIAIASRLAGASWLGAILGGPPPDYLWLRVSADGDTALYETRSPNLGLALTGAGVFLHPQDRLTMNGKEVDPRERILSEGDAATESSVGVNTSTLVPVIWRGDAIASAIALPPAVPLLEVQVQRAIPVYLHEGPFTTRLLTSADTVGGVLKEARVSLRPEDFVAPGPETPLGPETHIYIRHAKRLTITADGKTREVHSLLDTVGEVLASQGITLNKKDKVSMALSTPVSSGMKVRVVRVTEKTVIEDQRLGFKTLYQSDPNLEIDNLRLAQAGHEGLRKYQWLVTYEDGVEVSRVKERDWMEVEVEDKVYKYGTKIVVRQMDTPEGPVSYWRKTRVWATWYSASQGAWSRDNPNYGRTRLGLRAEHGVMAIDPSFIPFWTKAYVPGYGVAVAGDTGGAVKGRIIDLAFGDDEPKTWRTGWVDIYWLLPVPPTSQIRWMLPD